MYFKTAEVFHEYLEQYPLVAHRKVWDFFQNKDKMDKVNGPVCDGPASKWILWRKNIDFGSRTRTITVEGK